MQDAERLVGIVERVLYLKTLEGFAEIAPDRLTAIAELLQESFFGPGEILFRRGEFAEVLYFVVEGRVRLEGGGLVQHRGPRDVVGSPAVIEGRARIYTAVAESEVRALALSGDDLFDVLEDRFDMARFMIRTMARRLQSLQASCGAPSESGQPFCAHCSKPLDLVQKIVLLKSMPLLADATVDELARLAGEVSPQVVAEGEVVCREGETAKAFWLVLHGRVGPHGPRGLVGLLPALAGEPYPRTLGASEPTHLLKVPADGLFDMLEDHFDMTRRLVRNLSQAIRRMEAERAGSA